MSAPAWLAALLAGATVAAAGRSVAHVPAGASVRSRNRSRFGPAWRRRNGRSRRHEARRGIGPEPLSVPTGVLVVGVALIVVGPAATALALLGSGAVRALVVRRRRLRRARALERALPDLVDLFAIAAAAGHPVASCVTAVAPRAPAALRGPLAEVTARVAHGVGLAESLQQAAPALGPLGPALTDALVAAHRTGAPLVPVLHRVAATARDRRRREAEEAARRLPVALLFPLVCCILPAFALLAVVPLLAASLQSLRL